jgi:hypothetical protein
VRTLEGLAQSTVCSQVSARWQVNFGFWKHRAGWQLGDETTAVDPPPGGEVEFPLTINAQDAKGNILKMRLQVAEPKPEPLSNHSQD